MKDTLEKRFRAPLKDYYKRRIIVWKDEEGEFADTVAEMTLDNARILTMRKDCLFEIRRQIEVDYAEENLLIYCPMAFERVQDNWLPDVFLYGEEFRADYWSLLFTELNIENTRLVREYARSVSAFFASRERREKLSALRERYANEQELQTGIFGVLCGAKTYGIAAAVRAVLSCDPDEENPCLTAIEKFCGADAFWQAMEDVYGYSGARQAERLACHLLTTAATHAAEGQSLSGLPCNSAFAPQAFALFADWQRSDAEGLLGLCQRIEEKFDVERVLSQWNRDVLLRLSVFPVVDRLLIEPTLFSFAEGRFNIDDAETLLHARQDQAWAAHYQAYYRVVQALVHMQRFYLAYRGGFHYTSLSEAWEAYRKELYRMDQDYRLFCTAHDAALDCGILVLEDSLRAASDAVERLYKNWYLTELNEVWVQLISVQGVDSLRQAARQMDFYQTHVASQASRVYVVISDALRYEVAQELARQMDGKLNGNTQCEAMVGTLPGITPVGMAALLPRRALTMDDDLRLRCDGLSAEAPNRERILRAACAESVAVNYMEFRQCTKAQRTELVRGKKVVYIYHDSIDRAGESDANVFDACGEAIQELSQLMRILVHELSASTVFITADHGFLYTRSPLEEYEKAGKELIQGEMLEYKRRHAIVRGEGKDRMTVSIPLTRLGRPELTAVFPRGCMRFRLQGGTSAYMHGGLSLQEMALPLIRYQNKKAGQKGFQTITKTDILLLGDNRKISNNIFTLMFFQKEPCAGKVQPRTVLARFEDASGAIISDEHRIIGNMTETENSQRTVRTTFRLLGSGYDRTRDYDLVLIDLDEKREMERIPFKIDIVFENDFDF